LEEELLRNERLVTLGRMVAHVTHEIKNPLAVIGGFARQCERQQELSEENRRKVQLIHQEVQRLGKFLADLASFTHTAPTQKVPGDIVALIKEVAEFMEGDFREKGITFVPQAPGEIPGFPFDPGQMRQVLLNLWKNSLEAMPRGGVITVSAAVRGDYLELSIQDTGLGIPPDHLKSLFTPFFSTKEGGTGLGLTICRGLIDQHQGQIEFVSEVDRGTTCTIRLPLAAA
ncbi:MAG: ATP-binding protein, partial [Deltaproteobacteria bacterium]|nr:ATP-binding protein [Deltaproteobacteria bacterium]